MNNSIRGWKYCPFCGKDIQEEWKMCPYCGNALRSPDRSSTGSAPAAHETAGLKIEIGVVVKYTGTDKDVYIPAGVKEIGASAFEGSDIRRVYLPEGFEKLGYCCFSRCASLEHINIPKSLKTAAGQPFFGCNKLQTLGAGDGFDISVSPEMEFVPDGMFDSCWGLRTIELPSGIKRIGAGAFSFCKSIQQIRIPPNCTEVDDGAFEYCESLSEVSFDPERVVFKGNVFEKCEKLADENGFIIVADTLYGYYGKESVVSIPYGVKTIAPEAMKHLMDGMSEKILKIIIPDSVEGIGSFAFWGNRALTSVKMSNNIRWVGDDIFKECVHLDQVILGKSVPRELKEIVDRVEEKARARRNESEERQRTREAERRVYTVSRLQQEIEVFAKRYGGNRDTAERMAAYITAKLPDSIFTQGKWYFYDDKIAYNYEASSHSFFDDGGGEEYCTLWEFTYMGPAANKDHVIENAKLADTQAYPIFKGLEETFLCKDPFGSAGVFKVHFFSEYESYTD